MRAALRRADAVSQRTRELAQWGVASVEAFREQRSPALLQAIQDRLIAEHRELARRERSLDARVGPRDARMARCIGRTGEAVRARREHREAIEAVAELYALRLRLLYELGDTLAWILSSARSSTLALYSSERRSHRVPEGREFLGVAASVREINLNGQGLALCTDLTRIFALGDLALWPLEDLRALPEVYEAKLEKAEAGGGTIGFHGFPLIAGGAAPHLERLNAQLPFTRAEPPALDPRGTRQLERLEKSSSELMGLITRASPPVPYEGPRSWDSLTRVVAGALTDGACWVEFREGLVVMALRRRELPIEAVQSFLEDLVRRALGERQWERAALDRVRELEQLTAWLPPTPLWAIPPDHRAAVLAGELYLEAFWLKDLWATAFAAAGLAFETGERGWHLRLAESEFHLGPHEVAKCVTGVAFGGLTVEGIVDLIHRDLERAEAARTAVGDRGEVF